MHTHSSACEHCSAIPHYPGDRTLSKINTHTHTHLCSNPPHILHTHLPHPQPLTHHTHRPHSHTPTLCIPETSHTYHTIPKTHIPPHTPHHTTHSHHTLTPHTTHTRHSYTHHTKSWKHSTKHTTETMFVLSVRAEIERQSLLVGPPTESRVWRPQKCFQTLQMSDLSYESTVRIDSGHKRIFVRGLTHKYGI